MSGLSIFFNTHSVQEASGRHPVVLPSKGVQAHRIAALIVFDMIDDRFDDAAGKTAGVADALSEHRRTFVAPAEFHDEAIPRVAFFVGASRPPSVRLAR